MDARKLVGMTQGARKRAARWKTDGIYLLDTNGLDTYMDAWHAWRAKHGEAFCIGQRLRPCPGCQECGVRRFTKPEGFFTDNTHYIEIRNNAKVRLWRLKHTPILWRSKCGPRSVPTTFYDLEYCVGMVERFEWIELTQPNLCDGSGVIPAKARKVRR